MKKLQQPHLPNESIKHIIIGEKYRFLLENSLFKNNLEVIWLPDNPYTDPRLCGHADLSVVHTGGNRLFMTEYLFDCDFSDKLCSIGFDIKYVKNCGKHYPEDAGLNICIAGNKLIYNPDTADRSITDTLKLEKIPVKQGYTKCSVCVADESSIITSDNKIAQKAKACGMNVLNINEPFIKLSGFEYGFIGGATFKLGKNRLAFTGVIKNKEIRDKIHTFLNDIAVEPVYLTEAEIFDIGSAIPLTEE